MASTPVVVSPSRDEESAMLSDSTENNGGADFSVKRSGPKRGTGPPVVEIADESPNPSNAGPPLTYEAMAALLDSKL